MFILSGAIELSDYLQHVLKKAKKPLSLSEIYEKIERIGCKKDPDFSLSVEDRYDISKRVREMTEEYDLYQTPNLKYCLLTKTSFRKGVFHATKKGDGYVYTTISFYNSLGEKIEKTSKYFVPQADAKGAIDKDTVIIDTYPHDHIIVMDIINREIDNVVGEVFRIGSQYFVKPVEENKRSIHIFLEGEHVEGQIVSVDLKEQTGDNFYRGEIIKEFHHKNSPGGDVLLEAFKYGLPEGFSEESIKQLEEIPTSVREEDKIGRWDLTKMQIFSIDGTSTKDKDDCISLQRLGNGNYLLGVHIADVAHYIPEGSPIDQDAYLKGTSYYFGGFVEPQLPHKLSNGICSLNDGVERLTKSIFMEYDSQGNLIHRYMAPSVIHSRIGMNYDDVNLILNQQIVPEGYEEYVPTLLEMNQLAKILAKKRKKDGAIEFLRGELGFTYDDDHFPIKAKIRYQDSAESLIEEFMLASNVNVAEILEENNIPCIYRVHSGPSQERLGQYLSLLEALNIPFDYETEEICGDKSLMQKLTRHINEKGGSLKGLLNTQLIRCMSKAYYSAKNIGHYGTAFLKYCHFTSPIRRLADYILSRIIDECLFEKDLEIREKNIQKWNEFADQISEQASRMERIADEIERKVLYLESCKYLSRHIGEEFLGTIINISGNHIIVELQNLIEGKVNISDLPGDYIYNPDTFSLLSIDQGDNYYIGDELLLQLEETNVENKSIQFQIKEKISENFIPDKGGSNMKSKQRARQKRIYRAYQK